MESKCFLLRPPKSFLPKTKRKLKGKIKHHFWTKMPMYSCKWGFVHITLLHSFFFSSWTLPLLLFLFFFLLIYWAGFIQCSYSFCFLSCFFVFVFIFYFCLDLIFFWTWFLFFNKFRWLIFFLVVYRFFGFNWASFFNKGMCINLYKLTFSIPPFSHSQPKKKKGN